MRLYIRKTDISPMYNGEVGASEVGGSILDNLLNNTYCEVGEFCLVLYIETVT